MEHRERKSCSRRQTKVEYICTAVVVIALKKASGLEHNNKIVYSSSLGENGIWCIQPQCILDRKETPVANYLAFENGKPLAFFCA